MTETEVVVIGGGAAGLMAAVTAARMGAETVILEHMDRVGKKILATGNGKCNYTNALQGVSYYRGENPAFVLPVFEQFGLEDTIRFFEDIGIYPKCRNGYYYPSSEQAASILEVLRMEASYQGVNIFVSCEIKHIKKKPEGFLVLTNKDTFSCKSLLFAPGLLASPKTGSDGSAFLHIEQLGHHFIDIVPALVGLQAKQAAFKALAGIRAESTVTLYIDNLQILSESGELQLADYGISGIPVFQLSRYATRALSEGKSVHAEIDFLPRLAEPELFKLLTERFGSNAHGKSASEAMIGLFHKKLGEVLLKESGIGLHVAAGQISSGQRKRLCRLAKHFRADIVGSRSFEQAQVCAGGIDTREINPHTLESRLVNGVFFAGEVIDIDGICGGYNLQWAWSSGYTAGKHAALSIHKK